jgi:hypothetical protein
MPQTFYALVVVAPLLVFFTYGRQRIVRLPWIAVPIAIAMLCGLISRLAWPRPPADGDYTMMRIVGGIGTVMFLVGMINAWRMQSSARHLTKEIEAGLLQLESGTIQADVIGGKLQEQLEELAQLIAPIGMVPGSDITTAWIDARLREVAVARAAPMLRSGG